MAFYYVKSGGTATADAGRVATARTGAFTAMGASAYYDSIYDVFTGAVPTTAPASGDIIIVSDVHNKLHSIGAVIYLGITDNILVQCVEDGNVTVISTGAHENQQDAFVYYLTLCVSASTCVTIDGVNLSSGDDISLVNKGAQRTVLKNLTLSLARTGSSSILYATQDGSQIELHNVDLDFAHTGCYYNLTSSYLQWFGGSVVSGISALFTQAGNNSKGALLENVDLTALTVEVGNLADSSYINDFALIELNRCTLGSGIPLESNAPLSRNIRYIARSLTIGSATEGNNYFEDKQYQGTISEERTVYRDAGSQSPLGTKYSAAMVANANNSYYDPLVFELANLYIDTADYTTTIDFKISFCIEGTTTPLNTNDIYFEVEFTDGATAGLGVVSSSRGNILVDTAHSTTTSEWTANATNSQMNETITLTIGTTAGTVASGIVRINAYLAKASQTAFVCRLVDVS